MVHLDYRDARPIYAQIADNFRDHIQSGILRKGDRLPSVRDLASTLAINPNTIQRAYRELELGGYVATVPGKGCFVCINGTSPAGEEAAAWTALEKAVGQLLALGITKQAILRHLGGDTNA